MLREDHDSDSDQTLDTPPATASDGLPSDLIDILASLDAEESIEPSADVADDDLAEPSLSASTVLEQQPASAATPPCFDDDALAEYLTGVAVVAPPESGASSTEAAPEWEGSEGIAAVTAPGPPLEAELGSDAQAPDEPESIPEPHAGAGELPPEEHAEDLALAVPVGAGVAEAAESGAAEMPEQGTDDTPGTDGAEGPGSVATGTEPVTAGVEASAEIDAGTVDPPDVAEAVPAEAVVTTAENTALASSDVQPQAVTRAPGWPFLVYFGAWLVMVGLSAWLILQIPLGEAAFRTDLYQTMVRAGLVLTAIGPILGVVVWLVSLVVTRGRSHAGLLSDSLLKAAYSTLGGVGLWWATLLILDYVRLGKAL